MKSRNKSYRSMVAMLPFAAMIVVAGCSKKPAETSAGNGETPGTMSNSGGGAVASASGAAGTFSANCSKCHPFEGKSGGRAPDLSHIGGEKDAEWLAAYIKDPKSKDPKSKMPPFGGKIADKDVQELATMLAGKK